MNNSARFLPLSAAILFAVLLCPTSAARAATIYDLANDWSNSSDSTSNTWAYGVFTTAGDPATFSIPAGTHNAQIAVPYPVDFWVFTPSPGTDPNMEKNSTGSDITGYGSDWRAGKVSFGPAGGPTVAQFTAPAAGLYDISATFQTDQIRGSETSDGTTGFLYVNGLAISNTGTLQDPGSAQFGTAVTLTYNGVLLSTGEKVDFALGGGAFTTQVDATLTDLSAPEPSTYAMMLAGLAVLAFCVRRKTALAQ